MYKPILITCQPDDSYFIWQNHLYIESCLERGFTEDQIHILLYKPTGREHNKKWELLKQCYPKLNIFLYEDVGVQQYLGVYIPIIRPHILWQHFKKYPDLQEKTIIYTDCDILWTPKLDIEKFFDDDVSYISDASSYLNYTYFEGKKAQILDDKKEEAKDRDFLEEICSVVGVEKQKLIENDNNTGGVQYILKNVNAAFWKKIEQDTLNIRVYLLSINKQFYKSENAGIQSWCADLWAMQWNLWMKEGETRVVPEMGFSWAPDPITKLETHPILHNAGIVGVQMDGYNCFYKGKYHKGIDPSKDPHLDAVLNDEKAKSRCTWYYTNKLKELFNKYNLNY